MQQPTHFDAVLTRAQAERFIQEGHNFSTGILFEQENEVTFSDVESLEQLAASEADHFEVWFYENVDAAGRMAAFLAADEMGQA